MYKDIVILTKSKKYGKYCVAGIDIKEKEWVRLVSSNEEIDGALDDIDMFLQDGRCAEPLDLVRVPIAKTIPSECQIENNLIEYRKRWCKLGEMTIKDVVEMFPPIDFPYVFFDSNRYLSDLENANHSLELAEVEDLRIYNNAFDKRKADFQYNSISYSEISVTDLDYLGFEEEYFKKAYVVVSIPNKDYDGLYYKFVAKIFPVEHFFTGISVDLERSYTIKELVSIFDFPIPVRRLSWTEDFYYLIESYSSGETNGLDKKLGMVPKNTGRHFSDCDGGFFICKNKEPIIIKNGSKKVFSQKMVRDDYKHYTELDVSHLYKKVYEDKIKESAPEKEEAVFDFDKPYSIRELLSIFELPLRVKKDYWTDDYLYEIVEIDGDKTKGYTYKRAAKIDENTKYGLDNYFYVCNKHISPRFKVDSKYYKNQQIIEKEKKTGEEQKSNKEEQIIVTLTTEYILPKQNSPKDDKQKESVAKYQLSLNNKIEYEKDFDFSPEAILRREQMEELNKRLRLLDEEKEKQRESIAKTSEEAKTNEITCFDCRHSGENGDCFPHDKICEKFEPRSKHIEKNQKLWPEEGDATYFRRNR